VIADCRLFVAACFAALLVLGSPSSARDQDASSRARQSYARAIELQSQGNDAAALALLWEAAGLAPRDPEIQNRLGEALDKFGAFDGAIAAYRAALQVNADFKKASNNLIVVLVRAGKSDDAIQHARQMLAARPDDADRYFALGLAQSEQDIDGAIASFRRALELDPRHALASYNLAMALNRSDRTTEAIEQLKRTLTLDSRAETHYMLGVIYFHLGDFDNASRQLSTAIDRDARYSQARAMLGAVFKARREWERAERELRRAIALNPDPATYYALAQVLHERGDRGAATTALNEAEQRRHEREQDQEASVLASVGTAKLDAGDLTSALDLFRHATTVSTRYAPAYYQMGRTLERLGRTREAADAFARAAALNPSLSKN
jgi:tetratricopeptide (TPR) repeat protein